MTFSAIDIKSINTIRCLAADAVAKAQSGHPGAPMGLAPLAHVLFNHHLNFNPKNPDWYNRDRFILSNGHACMLQYIMLFLYGYEGMTLNDIKGFRQLHSKTPGHPENQTPGIEVTTGPLGQGISNAVGLAIGQQSIAAHFNKPGFEISDNYTYCIFGDGCMMEGVASEAMSVAGHLKLSNLIAFYDDNHISIDGSTDMALTENVLARLEAYGWHTICVKDGNSDLEGINNAITEAKKIKDKPVCIKVTTTIGFGSVNEGKASVHGSTLKDDDIFNVKKKFGFNSEQKFIVEDDVSNLYAQRAKEGAKVEETWNSLFASYKEKYPDLAADYERRFKRELPSNWEEHLPVYNPSDDDNATRKLSEAVLNKLFDVLPELIGGSADLTPSNNTRTKGVVDFQPPQTKLGDYSGRYIRYGVREHGMSAIMNGIASYGALIPYGGTFLNFVSYAAGAVRLAALSHIRVIWVATHDSIGLGEDGPTHQPVETLAHFRALPNIMVWRPADGNEVSAAYKMAIGSKFTPSIIALSRQNLPQLEGSSIEKASKGGYVLVDSKNPDIILVATGSEVYIAVDAAKKLKEEKGLSVRVVSLPDWHTFDIQSDEYRLSVLPDGPPIMSFEALSTLGWERHAHEQFGLDVFGASAPFQDVYDFHHFNPEGVAERALAVVDFYKGTKLKSPMNRALKGPFKDIS
ncbi:putative transketolase TktA [Nadsonia fulvescens var. elongata DSM 6958]|uniref:Transketolase n=1 Tax=Nadsonia fulvescens var. elongata DSM 6958 TaxID=857566 RepID=A0A1E3PP60_9ASCO|nr:putative transketolase TktA [Nadsonia fulvescens var. elongata DSM 6958]